MKREHAKHHYRFFVDPDSITGDIFISSDKDLINQIKNVFRLRKGDELVVLDGIGSEYSIAIEGIEKNKISGTIKNKKFIENKKKGKIRLMIPLIKNSNFDLILEKCTELGVDYFQPVICERSIIRLNSGKERWKKLLKEASEQSGRFYLPEISDPISLSEAVKIFKKETCVVAYEEVETRAKDIKISSDIINIFIGPEGGFSEKELKIFKDNSFSFFGINKNVLRSETACIVSVGIFAELC